MAYDESVYYVTRDDYLKFSGMDLDIELKKSSSDNPSQAGKIFIKRTQEWLYDHIETNFEVTTWDDDVFKKAVMYQMDYIRINGDNDKLAPKAFTYLHNNCMANPAREERYYGSWL